MNAQKIQNELEIFLSNFIYSLTIINEYSNKIFELFSSILKNIEKISIIKNYQNNSNNYLISNNVLNNNIISNENNYYYYIPPSKNLYNQFLNKKRLYKGVKYFKIVYTRKLK